MINVLEKEIETLTAANSAPRLISDDPEYIKGLMEWRDHPRWTFNPPRTPFFDQDKTERNS